MPMPSPSVPRELELRAANDQSSYEVRVRDVVTLVIGVGILVAPWFNGDDAATGGSIRLRIIAAAICAISLWLLGHQRDRFAEWLNAALGAAMVTAPFWRGGVDGGRIDFAIAGAIVFAFSASRAVQIGRSVHLPRNHGRVRS
jgi:hypothetical protein